MTARHTPDYPFNFHQRVSEVATEDGAPPWMMLYVVSAGTLITYNDDGSTTDWGSPVAGALIPGPHWGVDDASTSVVNGWRNEG